MLLTCSGLQGGRGAARGEGVAELQRGGGVADRGMVCRGVARWPDLATRRHFLFRMATRRCGLSGVVTRGCVLFWLLNIGWDGLVSTTAPVQGTGPKRRQGETSRMGWTG